MMRLSELANIVGGVMLGADREFSGVTTDSRNVKAGDLFVALQGPRFNGNDFVQAANAAGAVAAMVSGCSMPVQQIAEQMTDQVDGSSALSQLVSDVPLILVDDTLAALGLLAAAWRQRLSACMVVGVTGSNGKTTVKEMIAAILAETAPTWATQGNLNNAIGVPLTLLALRPHHHYAVVEMGANHPGEIAYLADLAKPDVAVLNNAGAAHLEGFGSLDGVARAKGELITSLAGDGVAVLNADDHFWSLWRGLADNRRVIAFGSAADAEVRLLPATFSGGFTNGVYVSRFLLHCNGKDWPMQSPLPGLHNASNAAAAAAAALALGLDMSQVQAGLAKMRPTPGRMQPLRCSDGVLVFNDTYNANPSSFAAALEVLTSVDGERWVVLGGFGELGANSAKLHADLGHLAKQQGVTRLFATGPWADKAAETFGSGATYCAEQAELIEMVRAALHENVVMLVKGSRSQRMERVVEALCMAKAA